MVAGMNLYLLALMDKPSLTPGWCVVCGAPYPTEHHPAARSQGGTKGPVLHLWGHGTRGCHGKAEDKRLHFRFTDTWEYIETPPMKYEAALMAEGWRACR